ncbi:hypothetical protein RI129_012788 [Pyrocoelia pectoralis]|uniref:Methyltransferase type 11 domain-containing protein n=1 Tax=Pyrocoelia pectoralis TaxID=417401 RepID=A0AAN7V355_9COLE
MANIITTSTVNGKQTDLFTQFRDVWWDINSKVRPLQQVDSLCLEYIKNVLWEKGLVKEGGGFQLIKELLILDVGCGGGILTEPLARAGSKIIGIDINNSAIQAAEEHAKLDPNLRNLSYRWESIEDHCAENVEKYDVVILNLVLHHSKNHEVLVENCAKVLKPGGLVFMSATGKTYEAWFRSIILGEYVLGYFVRGNFDWNSFINSSDVEELMNKHGCNVEGIRGICYQIYSSHWKWTDNTNGLYIMHGTKAT